MGMLSMLLVYYFNIIIILQLLSLTICFSDNYLSYKCIDNNGEYTKNSTFQTNLKTLLTSISTNTQITYGFYNFSVGRSFDKVNGIALCKGDLMVEECHTCLKESTYTLPLLCPTQKEAIVWYDNCTLHYSHRTIFGVKEEQPFHFVRDEYGSVTKLNQFTQVLRNLMDRLQIQAASGDSKMKFAKGEANFSNFQKVDGYCQCNPDLSRNSCLNCLRDFVDKLMTSDCQGARVVGPSCVVGHDVTVLNDLPNLTVPSTKSSTTSGKRRVRRKIWIIVIPALLSMLLTTLVCHLSRRKGKLNRKVERNDDQIKCVDSLQLDFSTIQVATDNFSNTKRIGQGSSAIVFKGVLPSGQEVAVKRLHKPGEDNEGRFNNEVLLSANLQHKNLVKFIGFCVEKDERFLVYEFVPNGSLDWFLDDPINRTQLDWETRRTIIQGIARGLQYLHEDSQVRVIHQDLKPNKILLSVGMNPKISSFGKASLVHADHTRTTSTIKGTVEYMPSEYVKEQISPLKYDVFSFGVILLEIISGQMTNRFFDRATKEALPFIIWRKWSEGKALDIVDQTMSNIPNYTYQITRCIQIALLCTQGNPSNRPAMSSVVLMLSSDTIPISEPLEPVRFMTEDELGQCLDHNGSHTDNLHRGSENGVSISDHEPR